MTTPRRDFLRHAALIGGAAVTVPLEALWHPAAAGRLARDDPGYGPLRPVTDDTTGLPLLQLPDGFRYRSFGWTGDPLDSGAPTPGAHDGMAAFPGPGGTVTLIRNQELSRPGSSTPRWLTTARPAGARRPSRSIQPPDS